LLPKVFPPDLPLDPAPLELAAIFCPKRTMRRSGRPAALLAAAAAAAACLMLPATWTFTSWAQSQRASGRSSRRATAPGRFGDDRKVEFNYLTQDYELKREGDKEIFGEEVGFSFGDLLPLSDAEQEVLRMVNKRLPNWRKAFMMPSNENGIRRRWRAMVDVCGGEGPALGALDRNVGILCISEQVTRAASKALIDNLGPDKAAEVVRKNPGILAIKASSLQGDGLSRTVFVADIIDFFCGPIGAPLAKFVQVFFVVALLKAVSGK